MPKYLVELKEIEIYHIEVEAEDEVEACLIVWDMQEEMTESQRADYYSDSDGEATVIEEID